MKGWLFISYAVDLLAFTISLLGSTFFSTEILEVHGTLLGQIKPFLMSCQLTPSPEDHGILGVKVILPSFAFCANFTTGRKIEVHFLTRDSTCLKCVRFDLQRACTLNECEIEMP